MVVNPTDLNITEPDKEIKKLMEKNLELTEKMYEMTKYIKRYVIWSQILSVLKIFIIVIPIALGIFYLPALLNQYKPMIDETVNAYRQLLGKEEQLNNPGNQLDSGKIDINDLPPQLQTQIKQYLQ